MHCLKTWFITVLAECTYTSPVCVVWLIRKSQAFCVFLGCLFAWCLREHQQWLNVFCRLGRYRMLRDALSSGSALQLPPCAVSQPLAQRGRAAPLTVPGAVQGKVGPAGFAGLGDISSQANCCSLSYTMQHSMTLHYQVLCVTFWYARCCKTALTKVFLFFFFLSVL